MFKVLLSSSVLLCIQSFCFGPLHFLCVLLYQKLEISLPVGYRTARPKTGDWEWLWCHFRIWSFGENRFLLHFNFYFLINNALSCHFLANSLPHNYKMIEKSVFRHNYSQSPVFSLAVSCPNGSEILRFNYAKKCSKLKKLTKNFVKLLEYVLRQQVYFY